MHVKSIIYLFFNIFLISGMLLGLQLGLKEMLISLVHPCTEEGLSKCLFSLTGVV